MKINGEKISQILKHFCLTNAEFAKIMGETPQNIQNWIKRGAGMTILEKLLKVYPEINMNWLLKDEGEMLVSHSSLIQEKSERHPNKEELQTLKDEIERLRELCQRKASTRVVVEFDVDSDEFVKLGLKDKVVQVLNK